MWVTERRLAVLQLVENATNGARFATMPSVLAESRDAAYRAIQDATGSVPQESLDREISELEREGLLETRNDPSKGRLVRVTGEGRRVDGLILTLDD